ncbi:MAG: carbohydrate ABC transporter substrate-binding protein [Oscillospiraceae bacterium]|nr:carbohydrate ABC transporter substrate-binding protein [Oscillospiraceae bacterium]
MKKIIVAFLALLMIVSVFAGCGKDPGTSSEEQGVVDLEKYPSGYPFVEGKYTGKTLTIWVSARPEKGRENDIYAEFERATGATVNDPGQSGSNAKFVSAVTAGTGPDISACDQNLFISGVLKGIILPVSDVLDLSEEIYQKKLDRSKVDFFSLNGVPYLFNALGIGNSCFYIVYNKSAFEAAGLEDPYELYLKGEWDFDAFNEACAALTYDSDDDGIIDKVAFTGYVDGQWPGCAENGNTVRWKDGRPYFAMTDSDMLEVYEEYSYIKKMGYFTLGDLPGTDYVLGKSAMLGCIGGWYSEWLCDNLDDEAAIQNIGYVPMPYAPSNTSKVVKSMGYASGYFFPSSLRDENKELAEEWIKYKMFWERADEDYEAQRQKIINNNYGGREDWYNFEQELCKNMFFNNTEMFGNLSNILSELIYGGEDSWSNMVQSVAPAAQAEIDAVFDDTSVTER